MGLRKTLVWTAVGAALAYFLDPINGRQRRDKLQQKVDDALQKRGVNPPWPASSETPSEPTKRTTSR